MSSNTDLETLMRKSALASYPNEACGVIYQRGKKSIPVACKNIAEDPKNQFLIGTEEYAAIREQGEVIGIWHTHVNVPPKPSDSDLVGCEATSVPWFIMSIYKNEVEEVSYSDIEQVDPSGFEMDYLGRPYVFGTLDCWTLVRDYYRREYGIALDEFPRIHQFWANGHDFFGENWAEQGFNRLIDQEPEKGDLFLMQTDNTGNPNHIGIYIGNEMMLHHAHGRLSTRDIYGGYWFKHTTHHLRHKSKC